MCLRSLAGREGGTLPAVPGLGNTEQYWARSSVVGTEFYIHSFSRGKCINVWLPLHDYCCKDQRPRC